MEFKNKKVLVCATSANLGPGFDTLGIALNLYNEFSLEKGGGEKTLADISFKKYYEYIGKSAPDFKIKIEKSNIPIARGLGSSASLIVAGLVLANELENKKLSDEEILKLATKIEGHPDNVAPAIFGGLILTKNLEEKIIKRKIEVDENLNFVCFVPDYKLSTEKARSVLPENIKRADAVENISNSAMLILSFLNREYRDLKYFLNDNIHEPYRKKLIKNYDKIKNLEKLEGVYGIYLSGAGPSMMAICENKKVFEKFEEELKKENLRLIYMRADNLGYRLI